MTSALIMLGHIFVNAKRIATCAIAIALVLSLCTGTSASSAGFTLTVYTAAQPEDIARYKEALQRYLPDVDLKWVRDSTGITTARLLAERESPRADVIMGLAASSIALLKQEGLLEPYTPANIADLDPMFVDRDANPKWIGMGGWAAGICVNTHVLQKFGLPIPKNWSDLTNPKYVGLISMPNPNSSGTGFLTVSSWVQMFGENKGAWQYMDALHDNIATYTTTGSAPCKMAASGDVPIGISYARRGAKLVSRGAPLEIVIPEEGIGWDVEAAAIVSGTQRLHTAQKVMDWIASPAANKIYSKNHSLVAISYFESVGENYPTGVSSAIIDNDFDFAAGNRAKILSEWQIRYDAKAQVR